MRFGKTQYQYEYSAWEIEWNSLKITICIDSPSPPSLRFSKSFKNSLHLSGAMVSLSLRICYVLKDVSGIFQLGFISFG